MRWLLGNLLVRHRSLGDKGERLAARWLRRHGYEILHSKYTVGNDEADLVALDPDRRTLVIVEVKTRSNAEPSPELGLNRTKQYRMARLASRLAKMRQFRDHPIRFDAVAIVWPPDAKPTLRHYPGAFESPF